jgi:type IV pilus assembly protein PilA
MKRQVQKGFTLIELMIVVAIIGILAAVALPAYQDYTKRARVTEGFNLAAALKTGVADFYASNNAFPSTNAEVGASTGAVTGASVSDVQIGTNGVITITYNGTVATASTANAIALVPATGAGGISWACNTAATTLPAALRPANCR